jgi:hypothetical protein
VVFRGAVSLLRDGLFGFLGGKLVSKSGRECGAPANEWRLRSEIGGGTVAKAPVTSGFPQMFSRAPAVPQQNAGNLDHRPVG